MKTRRFAFKGYIVLALFGILLTGAMAWAGGCKAVSGKMKGDIMASMNVFIAEKSVDGTFYMFDAVKGDLMRLRFSKLHDGVMKKGDFYVSCADFFDEGGRKVDLDFLVLKSGGGFITTQAVVHAIDGKKRKYHLE